MKIITVNLPKSYLALIDKMVAEARLYPTRSELIRVAIKEFLTRELHDFETLLQRTPIPPLPDPVPVDTTIVKVPFGKNAEGLPEFKTYRLVKNECR
jgi:Arc/MetJ-type ribon-helix-helix transcriptional regulator